MNKKFSSSQGGAPTAAGKTDGYLGGLGEGGGGQRKVLRGMGGPQERGSSCSAAWEARRGQGLKQGRAATASHSLWGRRTGRVALPGRTQPSCLTALGNIFELQYENIQNEKQSHSKKLNESQAGLRVLPHARII